MLHCATRAGRHSLMSTCQKQLVSHRRDYGAAVCVRSFFIYGTTAGEKADLISVLVYSAEGRLKMAFVSPSSTIFPFLMTMT